MVAQRLRICLSARDGGLIPGSGMSPGGGHGTPLQCSCLENPMDREEPGGLQSMGLQKVRMTEVTGTHTHSCNRLMI